jgi:hypothetical protein
MAAQPEASTVVRVTVEASTVVVAALVEAATEVAAEATVAESTRSIQLNPAKSKRARWADATVGPVSSYLSSPRFVAVISATVQSIKTLDRNIQAVSPFEVALGLSSVQAPQRSRSERRLGREFSL